MSTKPRASFMRPVAQGYNNLKEEILDIHKKVNENNSSSESVSKEFDTIKQEFSDIKDNTEGLNSELALEIGNAKGTYGSLEDRLLAMDCYNIDKLLENLTTTKTYEYENGNIVKEVVRGDLNYDVTYSYDNNNIVKVEKFDLEGKLLSVKNYKYVDENIAEISGMNTDEILMASNSLVTNELDARLKELEDIDFVNLAKLISEHDASNLWNIIQDLIIRVQNLEFNLPENQGALINIPKIYSKLEDIEKRLDENYNIYSFDVESSTKEYPVPSEVDENTSIYLEGLFINRDEDYILEDGKIKFLMDLIDGFTITCKF